MKKFFKNGEISVSGIMNSSVFPLTDAETGSLKPELVFLDFSLFRDFSELTGILAKNPLSPSTVILVVKEITPELKDFESSEYSGIDGLITEKFNNHQLLSLLKLSLLTKKARNNQREFTVWDLINIDTPSVKHTASCLNLFSHSNEGLWGFDLGENRLFLSESLKAELGYSHKQVPDTIEGFFKIVHPADKKRLRLAINEFAERKTSCLFIEIRLKAKNDGYKWFLYRGFGIWDENDKPLYLFGIQAGINSLKSEVARLENLALYDSLTSLPNRRLLNDRMATAIDLSIRNKKILGLLFIDLDKFKAINDVHGHQIGDLVLIETAKRLRKCVRKIDTLARLSGDEFVALLTDLNDENDILVVLNRIINSFSQPMNLAGKKLHVTCSVGHSMYPKDGKTIDKLLEKADMEMYETKRATDRFSSTVLQDRNIRKKS